MNGKQKLRAYRAVSIVLMLLVAAGTVVMLWFGTPREWDGKVPFSCWVAVWTAAFCFLFLSPAVLVHEMGHLLFGLCAGMRFPAVTVGHVEFSRRGVRFSREAFAAGESAVYPASPRNVRGRFAACSLGGCICNFLYGAAFLTFYFVLPYHPALLFFELFAPLSLYEGLMAAIPAELPAGRTDGAVLRGLKNREPFAEVTLAVLTAQAILVKGRYGDIPHETLFACPTVREDDASFLALLSLQWRYLYTTGDEEGAKNTATRLYSLADYLPAAMGAQIECETALLFAALGEETQEAEAGKGTGSAAAILRCISGSGSREQAEAEIKKEPLAGERTLLQELFEKAQNKHILRNTEQN